MRTVISIRSYDFGRSAGGQMAIRVEREPFRSRGQNGIGRFRLMADQQAEPSAAHPVKAQGQLLRNAMYKHAPVKEALWRMADIPLGKCYPLYILISEPRAERICWETLCNDDDDFIALDPRWPVGRIADTTSTDGRQPIEMETPVRFMALISALHIHGQKHEWKMLCDAIRSEVANGASLQAKVLVGDAALHETIKQDIAADLDLENVEVSSIDSSPTKVLREILDWSPNILHFFCHGRNDGGNQVLELATASDYLDPEAVHGKVLITSSELALLSTQLRNPWLLVLNCCLAGQAELNMHSMVHKVVSAGFRAAVAMSEPIDAADAHEFTGAFYRSVLAGLRQSANALKTASSTTFEWSSAMYEARAVIRGLHGEACCSHEWTLPMLYVRDLDPVVFVLPRMAGAVPPKVQTEVEIVASFLRDVGLHMREDERRAFIDMMLRDVPKWLRPSTDGSFGDADT